MTRENRHDMFAVGAWALTGRRIGRLGVTAGAQAVSRPGRRRRRGERGR